MLYYATNIKKQQTLKRKMVWHLNMAKKEFIFLNLSVFIA